MKSRDPAGKTGDSRVQLSMEVNMKNVSLAVLLALSAVASSAYAQSDQGVTMSTDPAKASDVEMRAQALQSQQDAMQSQAPAPMHHKGHSKKAMKHPASAS